MAENEAARAQYHRVQLDFSPESLEQLVELKLALGLKTKAEVIRYSMRVLEWMVQQAKSGNKVLVERNGGLQEVVFPFLPRPAANLVESTPEDLDSNADISADVASVVKKALLRRDRVNATLRGSRTEPATLERDSLSAAVEAGREAYQQEKAKQR